MQLIFRAHSTSGKGILSGHADGSVVRFFFDDEGSGESQVGDLFSPLFLVSRVLEFSWEVHFENKGLPTHKRSRDFNEKCQ